MDVVVVVAVGVGAPASTSTPSQCARTVADRGTRCHASRSSLAEYGRARPWRSPWLGTLAKAIVGQLRSLATSQLLGQPHRRKGEGASVKLVEGASAERVCLHLCRSPLSPRVSLAIAMARPPLGEDTLAAEFDSDLSEDSQMSTVLANGMGGQYYLDVPKDWALRFSRIDLDGSGYGIHNAKLSCDESCMVAFWSKGYSTFNAVRQARHEKNVGERLKLSGSVVHRFSTRFVDKTAFVLEEATDSTLEAFLSEYSRLVVGRRPRSLSQEHGCFVCVQVLQDALCVCVCRYYRMGLRAGAKQN